MRFFNGSTWVNYSDDAEDFYEIFVNDSRRGPQRNPIEYLRMHFSTQGTSHHPKLGDLNELADEILSEWDENERGFNLVVGFIQAQLDRLNINYASRFDPVEETIATNTEIRPA